MTLLEETTAWMDDRWDDDAGLVRFGERHHVRETCWYAVGLLACGRDTGRAVRALESVLGSQWDEPGAVYHGTFRRTPSEPTPGAAAQIWRDYDPNWRQFIGTALALIRLELDAELPRDLRNRIDATIRRAVAGEHPDRVSPRYSNIALMRAWLDAYAGARLGDDEAGRRGESMAGSVAALVGETRVFDEHNSPTYYGVNLYALALWRRHPPSTLFTELGSRLEAGLWREIATSYHAGLKNLCGPYDRAYGMDMRGYASLVGLWIREAIGAVDAPFPSLEKPFAHRHDACFGAPFAVLGSDVPGDVLPELRAFPGPHAYNRPVTAERVATAWLGEAWMAGGQDARGTRSGAGQAHPVTAHWAAGDDVGWLRLVHDGAVDATASRDGVSATVSGPAPTVLCIFGPGQVDFDTDGERAGETLEGARRDIAVEGASRFEIRLP